jgi:hypothetical protein
MRKSDLSPSRTAKNNIPNNLTRNIKKQNKKGQLTLLIIAAIVIILVIVLYFAFSGNFINSEVPREMRPIYDAYLNCLEDITIDGAKLMGQQAGYLNVPEFDPGSSYRPFSSQLNFMNQPVPYWIYASGNNILKEQIPEKSDMQEELATYLEERLDLCNLEIYREQGFAIYIEEGNVDVIINKNTIDVTAENPVNIYLENDSIRVAKHTFKADVRLGSLYDQARELYNFEKTDTFLEKYTIDTLRLHAPVDGVELSCKPLIFTDEKIRQNITRGLAANINTLKVKGSYYELQDDDDGYFVVDPGFSVDTNVNIIYDPSWPTRIEIHGDRVAKPVGLQEGLSILGFCYTPYHLVYDINYPVLIQLWEDDFFFQFPVSVIIEKNQEREALPPMFEETSLDSPICQFQNQRVQVYTYDSGLNPVEARIQFKCLDTTCEIGETQLTQQGASYTGPMPECINGQIIATAEGYAQTTYQISTNEEATADIILPKLYEIPLDLGNIGGNAVITFVGENYATTVLFPETKTVELAEDLYNISVSVYRNSTLTVQGINEQKCIDVPVQGIGNLLGLTEERCELINIPDMEIDSALVGGGKTQDYITEDALSRANELNLNVEIFPTPSTLDELQQIYTLTDGGQLYVSFE